MKKIYLFENEKAKEIKAELKKEYEILSGFSNIAPAQVFVAVFDKNDLRLGYELAIALEKYSKPTLVLISSDSTPSGILEHIDHPMYELKKYSAPEEIKTLIKQKVEKHFPPALETAAPADDACEVCAV